MTEQRAAEARNVLLGPGKYPEGIPEDMTLTQESKGSKSRNTQALKLIGTWDPAL